MTHKILLEDNTYFENYRPVKVLLDFNEKTNTNEWFMYGYVLNKEIKFLVKSIIKFEDQEVKEINFIRPLTNKYYDKCLNIYLDVYDRVIDMEMV